MGTHRRRRGNLRDRRIRQHTAVRSHRRDADVLGLALAQFELGLKSAALLLLNRDELLLGGLERGPSLQPPLLDLGRTVPADVRFVVLDLHVRDRLRVSDPGMLEDAIRLDQSKVDDFVREMGREMGIAQDLAVLGVVFHIRRRIAESH